MTIIVIVNVVLQLFCQVGSQMERVLELSSPRSPTMAIDWASANQCSTCLNAHANGHITVSTLLTP